MFDRLAAFRGVRAMRVRISKPDVYAEAHGVGVEIASFAEDLGRKLTSAA